MDSIERNKIYNGDSLEILKQFPENAIDLTFADPPFNIDYDYDEYEDNKEYTEYISWTEEWVDEVLRVTNETGSVYIAIGDEFAAEVRMILKERADVFFRNWIIWHYSFGQHMKKKFSRCHTHIFYVVLDKKDFTWNDEEIRVPSARQKKYNDSRANPNGKIPPDVWEFKRVAGTHNERVDHPAQMPLDLLDRIIRASSNRGDLVLDPFVGSGTTVVSAKGNNRDYVGVDISENYCNVVRNRLEETKRGGRLSTQ